MQNTNLAYRVLIDGPAATNVQHVIYPELLDRLDDPNLIATGEADIFVAISKVYAAANAWRAQRHVGGNWLEVFTIQLIDDVREQPKNTVPTVYAAVNMIDEAITVFAEVPR